jgi:hypothetical protein
MSRQMSRVDADGMWTRGKRRHCRRASIGGGGSNADPSNCKTDPMSLFDDRR